MENKYLSIENCCQIPAHSQGVEEIRMRGSGEGGGAVIERPRKTRISVQDGSGKDSTGELIE
jgi:hypothetical protein